MKAIKGIFDGKKIIPFEDLPQNKKFKVLITLLEEINNDDEIRDFSSQKNAFNFWNDKRENVYQDFLMHDKNDNR